MATTYIVLKPSIRENAKLTKRGETSYFYDHQVQRLESDEPNLYVADDIMAPSTRLPAIPSKYIKCVTYRGSIVAGFRPDGIYKFGRSRLEMKMDFGRDTNRIQQVSIQACGIKAAREIYSQVRGGHIEPVQKWSEKPSEV